MRILCQQLGVKNSFLSSRGTKTVPLITLLLLLPSFGCDKLFVVLYQWTTPYILSRLPQLHYRSTLSPASTTDSREPGLYVVNAQPPEFTKLFRTPNLLRRVREKNIQRSTVARSMRLTAELLAQAEQRTNPLGERELVLYGLGIPAIENGAATRDAFDCWDLSNNRITRLENFPKLLRLSNLLCAGNLIESFDAANMSSNLPNLRALVLTQNNLTSFSELAQLGLACPKLEFLAINGNPVTSK